MAVTTSQEGSTLPLPANIPTKTICIELDIPDDPDFFRLFYGALDALSNWFAYDRDTAHKGRLVAALWRKTIRSIRPCPGPSGQLVCGDCGDCDCCGGCMTVGYRQQGCLFQKYDCLTGQWVTVYDGSLCVTNPAPGGGVTPPTGGQCQAYTLFPKANAITPLPFLINTGDTITITSEMGAGSDGTLDWRCPDGSFFIAGACAGGGAPQSGDPLPTTNHMALILRIGSSYYPLPIGTFTVPSAIVNAQAYIQVNDASLTDDTGEYTVSLNYCNNAAPPTTTWCASLDLTVSPHGIVSYAVDDGCPAPVNVANWQSGNGWVVPAYTISCSPTFTQYQGTIALDMGASVEITSVELKGNYVGGATGSRGIDVGLNTTPPWSSSVLHPISVFGYAAGPFDLLSGAIAQVCRYIQIDISDTSHGAAPGATGYTLTKLILKGAGVNPFGADNC